MLITLLLILMPRAITLGIESTMIAVRAHYGTLKADYKSSLFLPIFAAAHSDSRYAAGKIVAYIYSRFYSREKCRLQKEADLRDSRVLVCNRELSVPSQRSPCTYIIRVFKDIVIEREFKRERRATSAGASRRARAEKVHTYEPVFKTV